MSNIKETYHELTSERDVFYNRSKYLASLTIPSLVYDGKYPTNFGVTEQSLGSEGINNLSSKILAELLPSDSFFNVKGEEDLTVKLLDIINNGTDRLVLVEGLKHLILGNVLFIKTSYNEPLRMYPLNSYVVRRKSNGEVQEVVTLELVCISDLSEELKAKLDTSEKEVELYTQYSWNGEQFVETQMVGELILEPIKHAKGCKTVLPLRFTHLPTSNYGLSGLESIIADLKAFTDLSQALREAGILGAKYNLLVDPNGNTHASDITEARNGDALYGTEKDIGKVDYGGTTELTTTYTLYKNLERRLSKFFLMADSVVREQDRVTATEVLAQTDDFYSKQSGLSSSLQFQFQLPYIKTIFVTATYDGLFSLKNIDAEIEIVGQKNKDGKRRKVNDIKEFLKIVKDSEITDIVDMKDMFELLSKTMGVEAKFKFKDVIVTEGESVNE